MADTTKPLLNLDTITEASVVIIDGAPYPLHVEDEYTIVESHKIRRQYRELGKLLSIQDALTDEQETALTTLLDEMCRKLLEAPDDVHKRLKDQQRLEILGCFRKPLQANRPPAGETAAAPATGATSSPDSSASIPAAVTP